MIRKKDEGGHKVMTVPNEAPHHVYV